jgi:hypothetical protein
MILLSHLKTGISASEYAKQFIRTATREREPKKILGTHHCTKQAGAEGKGTGVVHSFRFDATHDRHQTCVEK